MKTHGKKVMPFVQEIKQQHVLHGDAALQNESPIDQQRILEELSDYIKQKLEVAELQIVNIQETPGLSDQITEKCAPMNPLVQFDS